MAEADAIDFPTVEILRDMVRARIFRVLFCVLFRVCCVCCACVRVRVCVCVCVYVLFRIVFRSVCVCVCVCCFV